MYRCMYEGLNCLMIAEDWNMQIIKSQQIILHKIGILVRVVHLGLIIIAPPISVFVLVDLNLSQGLTRVLPSEERNTISSTVILNGLAQDY